MPFKVKVIIIAILGVCLLIVLIVNWLVPEEPEGTDKRRQLHLQSDGRSFTWLSGPTAPDAEAPESSCEPYSRSQGASTRWCYIGQTRTAGRWGRCR